MLSRVEEHAPTWEPTLFLPCFDLCFLAGDSEWDLVLEDRPRDENRDCLNFPSGTTKVALFGGNGTARTEQTNRGPECGLEAGIAVSGTAALSPKLKIALSGIEKDKAFSY